MTCKTCLEKAYEKYRNHGFNHEQATYMAKKLMRRVEKRQRKERIRFFYRNINSFLWKWTFLCNWKATLFYHVWIGKSYNPDYTKGCTIGTCSVDPLGCTQVGNDCTTGANCIGGSCKGTGTCACPAPLANSTQVSGCSTTCHVSSGICNRCIGLVCTPNCVVSCAGGTCGYNCDVGFVWNGVICVPAPPPSQIIELPKMGVGL